MTLRTLHGTLSRAVLRVERRNVCSSTARSRISVFTVWTCLQQIATVIVELSNAVLWALSLHELTDISAMMDDDALYDAIRRSFGAKHENRVLAQITPH